MNLEKKQVLFESTIPLQGQQVYLEAIEINIPSFFPHPSTYLFITLKQTQWEKNHSTKLTDTGQNRYQVPVRFLKFVF